MPITSPENVLALRPTDEMPTPRRFGLSKFEQLGIERLISGDASAAIEHARQLAEALSSPGKDEVRLRTTARLIAAAKMTVDLLQAVMIERLNKRDIKGVEITERVLRTTSASLVKWIEAHRLESSQQRRVAVVVTHADQVNVEGVR